MQGLIPVFCPCDTQMIYSTHREIILIVDKINKIVHFSLDRLNYTEDFHFSALGVFEFPCPGMIKIRVGTVTLHALEI